MRFFRQVLVALAGFGFGHGSSMVEATAILVAPIDIVRQGAVILCKIGG